jgi:chromosome segregation ATPase
MQRRTDEAEADAAQARAAAEAAAGVRDTAFARARQLQDTLSTTDAEVDRLKTEVANRDAHLAELDVGFSDLQRRIDAAQSATSKAVQHREHAMRKVAELQDLLTSKTAEADSLRSEAVTSQRKEAETRARGKALEGELAQWHARANALEGTTTLQQKSVVSLTADIEATSQQLATAEQEITTLRDELARRPPIDVIRQLDVDNLMQRNMQAAAAMQQLLAWQEAHASSLSTSNMTSSVARS